MNVADKNAILVERPRENRIEERIDDDSEVDFLEYWRILRRHWISVVVLGLIGYFIAVWHANSLTPMYSSTVTLVVDPSRGVVSAADPFYSYYAQKLFYDTQQTVLMSREIAERTAQMLSQAERERLIPPANPGLLRGILDDLKGGVRNLFDRDSGRATAEEQSAPPSSDTSPAGDDRQRTRSGGIIQGGRSVSPSRETQIMRIHFTSHDPEIAALVANTMAEAYITYTNESQESLSEQSVRWMAQQVERLRATLTESQNALQEFQLAEGLVNLDDIQSLASARLQALNSQLAAAERQFEELSERYGPRHPRLIQAQSDLDNARRQLSSESSTILQDADKRFQLAKLENDVKGNQEIYELFLNRFRQMDVTTSERISPIYMLDRAQAPGGPISPNKQRIGSLGLALGLFFGLFLAWLREKLDNTFHTPTQLESELGLPTLGAVPFLSRDDNRIGKRMARQQKRRGPFSVERYYVHHGKSPFAESINHIRTGILFSRAERVPKTVLISSAIQSEGKTTLAANLAFALSQMGDTLLIDADLRKPRVHQITTEGTAEGLVELLVGRVTMEDVLVGDEGSSTLKILKSGVIPPNPQEMLSSSRFDDLLSQFEKMFEYIVIDCAPVLPVSDALILSSKVDAFIMLVKANATTRQMVKDAVKRAQSVSAPLIGTVLAQFDHRRSSHYGRYSYYSKYYSYAYGKRGRPA